MMILVIVFPITSSLIISSSSSAVIIHLLIIFSPLDLLILFAVVLLLLSILLVDFLVSLLGGFIINTITLIKFSFNYLSFLVESSIMCTLLSSRSKGSLNSSITSFTCSIVFEKVTVFDFVFVVIDDDEGGACCSLVDAHAAVTFMSTINE
jgi:hypothetical protein